METQRAAVIRCYERMAADHLTLGSSGNVSVRHDQHIAITPSGVPYGQLTPGDIVTVDLKGRVLEGELPPSSELPMHLLVYAHSEAQAIVHTHPVWATVVGTLVDEVPLVHYMLASCGGAVRVVPYARFGSQELAEGVLAAMAGRNAVLLRNHGAVTWGGSLEAAYDASLYLEWACEVWGRARAIGSPALLTPAEVDAVGAAFAAGRRG